MTYTFTAIITPSEDGGKFYAKVPDVPGCVTTGKSLTDAIAQITDALSGCLVVAEDENLPISQPTEQSEIDAGAHDIRTLICVDTISYRAQTDERSVRKNVSLPAWMVTLADKRGINCSKVLQDALRTQLS